MTDAHPTKVRPTLWAHGDNQDFGVKGLNSRPHLILAVHGLESRMCIAAGLLQIIRGVTGVARQQVLNIFTQISV